MTQQISSSIIVNRPAHHVYSIWADFNHFPKFMEHVKSVTVLDESLSHWVVAGPLGTNIDWNAEITRQEPHARIAWNTKDNKGIVTTSGQVTFNPLPESQTEVTVTMQVTPPGGRLGEWLSGFFTNPEKAVVADLRRFKTYTESVVLSPA